MGGRKASTERAPPNPGAVVLIFVRAPQLGRVKTRLAAAIGDGPALAVYRRLAEQAVAEALALAPLASVRVHFTPPDQHDAVAGWLGPGPEYRPQSRGNLGERLQVAFEDAFSAGFEQVLVIGSDLPDLSVRHLRRALDLLDRSAAVIGPARDGGYWLLGLRTPCPGVFSEIAWSTDAVLSQTLARFRACGVEPACLEELADVDEVGDLPVGWTDWALASTRQR